MKEINTISIYFIKMSHSFLNLFTTPLGISVTIPIVALSAASRELNAIYWLGILMFVDFATGIGASYVEKKKQEKTNPELKEKSLISSEKMKLSLLKLIMYFLAIQCSFAMERTFLLKPFEFSMLQEPVSISLLCIGFCCAIEFISIFFENFKRMGLDLLKIIGNVFSIGKQIKETIS